MTAKMKRHPPGAGSIEQQLRLYAGLVLFVFVSLHFLNHALGNISLAAMNWGQDLRYSIWHSKIGSWVLYNALTTHVALALWKIARRRTFKMPVWEAVQIVLGLLIPYVLIKHIVTTRGAEAAFNSYIDYQHTLSALWPNHAFLQSSLLVIVWLHGCIGLHYWLRMKSWYAAIRAPLFLLAVMIPLLSLTGWISAARRLVLEGQVKVNITAAQQAELLTITEAARGVFYAIAAGLVLFFILRKIVDALRHRISIRYLDTRTIKTVPGPTLLEISRMKGIPHMSICGGRARCSTCRTLILSGQATIKDPGSTEAQVLKRIGASSNVRLACQIRPTSDMTVRPLFSAGRAISEEGLLDRYRWGVEQKIAIMFIDLRGFTSLSEGKLPFDVVFILNRYVDGVVRIINKNGGMVDKIMGDGIMALYGVETSFEAGVHSALATLADLSAELTRVNDDLAGHLDAPLRVAVGLHGGIAILGRIGLDGKSGAASGLTALGDVVNVAARLEGVAKEENAMAAISRELLEVAAVSTGVESSRRSVVVRGRQAALEVVCFSDFGPFEGQTQTPSAPSQAQNTSL
ncbi:adenylate/guanylate cyclase domain-containing protein [Labrenzia sp. CE80]|uniref:adenylate/guanylate cyclase domain-containing protein n=1 Tax=Labrenzia sp. CE80 TaxID=1788986 RepID=UPI00129B606E|nr:adenylate/guanylate cyclase domain-containing protein [Labrenzia sp. CE80]